MGSIKVPQGLDQAMLEGLFGRDAVSFYLDRIAQRQREGKVYYNPLKTIYLWAAEDKAKCQGFWSSYRGFSHGRRRRNYGGS